MQQITVLQHDYLNDVIVRVFRRQETTLSDEALHYQRADFEATLRDSRAELRATLQSLPELAFAPQPPDGDGAEVWSAGQVVCHLMHAAVVVGITDMRAFLGLPAVLSEYEQTELPEGHIATRAQALSILDAADRDLETFFADLPITADLRASGDSAFFGPISVGGYLLAWCYHERNHAAQAAALA